MSELNFEKLPQGGNLVEPAVMYRGRDEGGLIFGTLHTIGINQLRRAGISPDIKRASYAAMPQLEDEASELYRGITACNTSNASIPSLLEGWERNLWWYDDEMRVANFVGLSYSVKHDLELSDDRIPPTIGLLLSGYLVLGEKINFRNFRRYETGKGLKYLPFVILPEQFRYYIYQPTIENQGAAVAEFRDVLERTEEFKGRIKEACRIAYSIVRLCEVAEIQLQQGCDLARDIDDAIDTLGMRFDDLFGQWKGSFGYLLKPIGGPADAKQFSYEMYQK